MIPLLPSSRSFPSSPQQLLLLYKTTLTLCPYLRPCTYITPQYLFNLNFPSLLSNSADVKQAVTSNYRHCILQHWLCCYNKRILKYLCLNCAGLIVIFPKYIPYHLQIKNKVFCIQMFSNLFFFSLILNYFLA
jgi:hypothetical protein